MRSAIIIAVLLVVGVFVYQKIGERRGLANGQLKQGQTETKTGEKTLDSLRPVYVLDTIKLAREVTKYRTIRDTLVITDTVIVREFVRQADSTIKACLLTVQTCEQKDSAHSVIETGLRKQNDALKKLLPTKTERFITAAKWALVGALVGAAYSHK
jgi:hypothetical protein